MEQNRKKQVKNWKKMRYKISINSTDAKISYRFKTGKCSRVSRFEQYKIMRLLNKWSKES